MYYVVKKGDNLIDLAQEFYGKAEYWKFFFNNNKLRDTDLIRPGQELNLISELLVDRYRRIKKIEYSADEVAF